MKRFFVGARHALPVRARHALPLLMGILALGLVFGFGLAGCSSDSGSGAWGVPADGQGTYTGIVTLDGISLISFTLGATTASATVAGQTQSVSVSYTVIKSVSGVGTLCYINAQVNNVWKKVGVFFYKTGGTSSTAYFGKTSVDNVAPSLNAAFSTTIDTNDMVSDSSFSGMATKS